MNAILSRYPILKKWWLMYLSHKKESILAISGLVLFSLLLIMYLINNEIAFLNDKIVQDQKLVAWMAQTSNEIKRLRSTASQSKPVSQASLLALVDQEAKSNSWNKYLMEMKQGENTNQVELSFNRINFDDLISGLEQLNEKDNIQVGKINVQRLEATNFVKATLFLEMS